jgi:O-antigen ligase
MKKVRWLVDRAGMIRHSSRLTWVPILILLLAMLYAPLPFAGVLPRDRALLDIAAFVAVGLVFLAHESSGLFKKAGLPLAILVGLAGWGLVQSLPWPTFLVSWLSPRAVVLWENARALTAESAESAVSAAGAVSAWTTPLSLAPAVTRQVALHWLALAAALVAATAIAGDRLARRLLIFTFLLSALFQVAYGAGGKLSQGGKIWGVAVESDAGRLRGTFVNPDHFAFFMALATVGAAAWLWWALRKSWRDRVLDRALVLIGPAFLCFVTLFTAVAFSGSRAGLVALVAGLMAQGLVLAIHYRRWQFGLTGIGLLALALAMLATFGFERGLARWLETSAYELTWNARREVFEQSLRLWLDFKWVGTGLGTFRQAFPLVQPSGLASTWEHAHSDLLELMVTTGILAWPLVGLALFALARRLYTLAHLGRRSEDRAFGLAVAGACAMALVHSCVDFSLTNPANAFCLAIICGLALGAPVGHRLPGPPPNTVFLPRDADVKPLPASAPPPADREAAEGRPRSAPRRRGR